MCVCIQILGRLVLSTRTQCFDLLSLVPQSGVIIAHGAGVFYLFDENMHNYNIFEYSIVNLYAAPPLQTKAACSNFKNHRVMQGAPEQ